MCMTITLVVVVVVVGRITLVVLFVVVDYRNLQGPGGSSLVTLKVMLV